MHWFSFPHWNDHRHKCFYDHYRQADAKTQALALLTQAKLLIEGGKEIDLRAAESLLLQWLTDHLQSDKVKMVYLLLARVNQSLGDGSRASEFRRLAN